MSEILIKEKDVVVPGQILAIGMDYLPAGGSFRENDKIVSNHVGLVHIDNRLIRVIPLKGRYAPKRGDTVIGKVVDMSFNNWYVDIECANDAVLSLREGSNSFIERGADLSQIYTFGDYIAASVNSVTKSTIEISMKGPSARKLGAGKIIKIDSSKVPRIIGKQGSMISMIKQKTGCNIIVGQNGIVWIQGSPENEILAASTIYKINNESHKEGLTEQIAKELDEILKSGSEKNVQEKV